MNTTTENVIGQVLEPVFRTLPPDIARRIVDLEADEQLQQRVEDLARKANEGELTEHEERDYAALVSAGDILATLQALARRSLRQTSA